MSLLRWVARQLSLEGNNNFSEHSQHQMQQHNQTQQEDEERRRQRQQWQQQQCPQRPERQQPHARPPGPRGPCGTPGTPPTGGAHHRLPLESALVKGRAPWCTKRQSDLSLVQLLPGQDVLRVRYPAGSGTPSSSLRGGVQIVGQPRCLPATVLLRFDFRTAANFDWTRGGKLGGGLSVGHGAAAGYRHSATAASARLTWGPDGFLHLYIYPMEGTQQDATYTDVARLGGGCGDSMFPGTLQVQKGVWNSVVMRVRLNTPGRADGVAGLGVNGQYRSFDRMVWRTQADTLITQVMLVTFFGGSWTTPVDTAVDFANFSLTVLE